MPTITNQREYSTSKNIKVYLLRMNRPGTNPTYITDTDFDLDKNLAKIVDFPLEETNTNAISWCFNKIPNLQEIPDLASGANGDRDTIEITTLEDDYHEYADGLKNRSDDSRNLSFTFLYDGTCYDTLRAEIESMNEVANAISQKEFKHYTDSGGDLVEYYQLNEPYFHLVYVVLADGSTFAFRVKDLSTTISGAGVNAALTFQLNCAVDGDIHFYHADSYADQLVFRLAGVLDGGDGNYHVLENVSSTSTPAWGIEE